MSSKDATAAAAAESTRRLTIDRAPLVNAVTIREAVVSLLRVSNLDELTMRKVMAHLAEVLHTNEDVLSTHRDVIKSIIVDFKDAHDLQLQPKTYRLSKAEDEIILRAIEQYKAANDVTDAELMPMMREGTQRGKRHRVWADLAEMLPHRKRKAIILRGHRLLREKNGQWGETQIDEIEKRVKMNMQWSEIAQETGFLREDCRGVYMRTRGRKISGRFSSEEDQLLYEAIKKMYPFEDDFNLPTDGIKWKDIADALDNQRYGCDYCRRWRIVVDKRRKAALAAQTGDAVAKDKNSELRHREDEILEYITECGAEDPSEVTWTDVDRKFSRRLGSSGLLWNTMLKSVPPGTSFLDAVKILKYRRSCGRPATMKQDKQKLRSRPTASLKSEVELPKKRKKNDSLDLIDDEMDAANENNAKRPKMPKHIISDAATGSGEIDDTVKDDTSTDPVPQKKVKKSSKGKIAPENKSLKSKSSQDDVVYM